MPSESPLQSRLAANLPLGVTLQSYHLSTPPRPTSALFAPLPGHNEETTCCESHFLAVSSPEDDEGKEILVYAVEILIFTTASLTTLFVSKADSSGFSSRLHVPKGAPSVIAAITSAFVEFLLEPRLTKSRVVLSLFARAQNQYLFPGSVENAGKHVLDDRQLIKWWCRVLDKVLRLPRNESTATAHLLVPGCDKGETRAFFPLSSQTDSPSAPKWINSYPVELLVADTLQAPRHLIPRLPDDPKARFLDDLDGDYVDERGQWRSLKSLDQFWEMLSYRQECSAGRLVGFLWLVFSHGQTTHASLSKLEQIRHTERSSKLSDQSSLLTPENSRLQENGVTESEVPSTPSLETSGELKSPPPSSPIQAESTAVPLEGNVDRDTTLARMDKSVTAVTEQTKGEIVIDASQYEDLMDFLLQTDFAGEDLAAKNTRAWIEKALEFSNATVFGRLVRGTQVLALANGFANLSSQQVNVLTGVRQKRKVDVAEDHTRRSDVGQNATTTAVNTLPAGLVRKKPKR